MTRRAYMNNTDEAVTYKVWAVPLDAIKPNHFPTLKSHNIPARCVMDNETVTASNGSTYRYGREGRAEFDTTDDEQEVILKLLYGSELQLITVTVSMPYSIMEVSV